MQKKNNFQFAKALYEVTKNLPDEHLPEVIKQFVLVLQKNNKLKKADKIIEEFINYSKKQNGFKTINVQTANKINNDLLIEIKKVFGEKSEIVETVDQDMIGGIKIVTEGTIYDASLKTQLKKLKEKLIS